MGKRRRRRLFIGIFMGVSITGLKIDKMEELTEDCDKIELFTYEGFERSLLPEEIVTLGFDSNGDLINGEYLDSVSMTYGFYNQLRDEIATVGLGISDAEVWGMARNLPDKEDYPHALYYLINFADNEGFIGPKAVKLLSNYFKGNMDLYKDNLSEHDHAWFKNLVNVINDTAENDGYLEFS